jgi:hypothetical protein
MVEVAAFAASAAAVLVAARALAANKIELATAPSGPCSAKAATTRFERAVLSGSGTSVRS